MIPRGIANFAKTMLNDLGRWFANNWSEIIIQSNIWQFSNWSLTKDTERRTTFGKMMVRQFTNFKGMIQNKKFLKGRGMTICKQIIWNDTLHKYYIITKIYKLCGNNSLDQEYANFARNNSEQQFENLQKLFRSYN